MRRSEFLLAVSVTAFFALGIGEGRTPGIEPEAERRLREMCASVGGLERFEVKVEKTMDFVRPFGPTVQYEGTAEVAVERPARWYAASTMDDGTDVGVWYDGEGLTLLDRTKGVFAIAKDVPPTLDEALDFALEEFALVAPLHDLLYADPCSAFLTGVVEGVYVGVHGVRGAPHHHLAFAQEDVDWQIWIAAEGDPLPGKMVISYKREAGAPQFTGWMKWNASPRFDASRFTFRPPRSAQQIEFLRGGAGR